MSGFVGSSLVGFLSLLIFLPFMSQFYAFCDCPVVSNYRGGDSKRKGHLFSKKRPDSQLQFLRTRPYRTFDSGLVDSSFLDFFKVFFAMSLFSLSSCPSGADVAVMCNCDAILCKMVQLT
jgi:hypothetical protein